MRKVRVELFPIFPQLDSAVSHGKDADVKASCNTLVESFAFPEQMLPDVIQKSDRDYCRKVVHKLAKCLSKHKVGNR